MNTEEARRYLNTEEARRHHERGRLDSLVCTGGLGSIHGFGADAVTIHDEVRAKAGPESEDAYTKMALALWDGLYELYITERVVFMRHCIYGLAPTHPSHAPLSLKYPDQIERFLRGEAKAFFKNNTQITRHARMKYGTYAQLLARHAPSTPSEARCWGSNDLVYDWRIDGGYVGYWTLSGVVDG